MALLGKWTPALFLKYHRANPHIWTAFERFTFEAIASGKEHYSAGGIYERMRWETDIVEQSEMPFKIDDGWLSHYARLFMERHPEHQGFFRTRVRGDSYHTTANSESPDYRR